MAMRCCKQRLGMQFGCRPRGVAMAVDELLQGFVEGPGRLRVIIALPRRMP